MALGAEIIYLVRLYVAKHLVQRTCIVQVAVVEVEVYPRLVGVLVNVVYPSRIKGGRSADHAMHFIALF
jgi:ribosomal protein S8E